MLKYYFDLNLTNLDRNQEDSSELNRKLKIRCFGDFHNNLSVSHFSSWVHFDPRIHSHFNFQPKQERRGAQSSVYTKDTANVCWSTLSSEEASDSTPVRSPFILESWLSILEFSFCKWEISSSKLRISPLSSPATFLIFTQSCYNTKLLLCVLCVIFCHH